jgi:hypothetical protein
MSADTWCCVLIGAGWVGIAYGFIWWVAFMSAPYEADPR